MSITSVTAGAAGSGRPSAEPSARAWLRALDARECSARELVERTLGRIERVDTALNAAVSMEPELSLAAADAADRRRAAGDESPMLGIPVTVKDSLDVAGWITTGGSFARQHHRARRDATAVHRLRRAGAIVVAKTNLPECSSAPETDNALFGRTCNPHDLARTPGGSSGGEAALLAADASVVGVGADGGASIRLPSHYCGTVGIRPSIGRVPETGVWPATRTSGMLDLTCVGPMARYVEDLELMLPVMSGADGIDPFAPPVPPPVTPEALPQPLRVAFYVEDPLTGVTPETARAVHAAAEALVAAGGDVREVEAPATEDATLLFFRAVAADGGEHLKRPIRAAAGRHTPFFADLLETVLPSFAPQSENAYEHLPARFELRARLRRFVDGYDVVVAPVAPGPAPRFGEPPGGQNLRGGEGFDWINFASTFAIAGVPTVVVRTGWDGHLPIGVQIASGAFRDGVALAAARCVEAAAGGFVPARTGLGGV